MIAILESITTVDAKGINSDVSFDVLKESEGLSCVIFSVCHNLILTAQIIDQIFFFYHFSLFKEGNITR